MALRTDVPFVEGTRLHFEASGHRVIVPVG